MFEFIGRWLGSNPRRLRTRLSQEQVLAIARRAASNDALSEHLSMAKPELQGTKTVWIVTSATVGLALEVLIDDSSGEVLKMGHVGVR